MTARPFVSVVVPHLNQPGPLAACLDALARQSYPRAAFEVIVADNGSEASPADIVARLEGARLVVEPRPGPGPARNRGVAESRGEILAFIDADCVADRGWLEAAARRLGEPDGKIVVGGDVRIAVRDPGRPTAVEAYESVFAFRQEEYIEKKGFSGAGNLAVRRRDFDRVGPFAGIDMAEDRDWGRRATGLGYRLVFAPEMIVHHPARGSLEDLCFKWDRHIRHDFRDWTQGGAGMRRWVLRSLAVALSPLVDARKVFAPGAALGARARVLAIGLLFRIRLHRAALMLRLAADPRLAREGLSWNRERPS